MIGFGRKVAGKNNPVIAIRADGNQQLASGHLRRCLSIAEELRIAGAKVYFCLADEESRRMLDGMSAEDAGRAVVLRSDYLAPAGEIPILAEILRERMTDILLIDHYMIDDRYLEELLRSVSGLPICLIDDFVSSGRPADLIIHYLTPDGFAYVPLRPQFREHRMPLRREVRRVFLSTGGSDPYRMCDVLGTCVRQTLPGIEIAYPQGVDQMAAFMADCDLAVSAGGTTVYELCAVGVPTILYTMADNQQSLARGLKEVVTDAGDIRDESGRLEVIDRIRQWLMYMVRDPGARQALSEREKTVTDGYGAQRIARKMLSMMDQTE